MLRFRMQCDGIAIGVLETEKASEWPVLKARKYLNSSGHHLCVEGIGVVACEPDRNPPACA
jgi:hypothetical protein